MTRSARTIGEALPTGQASFDPRAAQEAGRLHVALANGEIAGFAAFWEDGMALHIQRCVAVRKHQAKGAMQILLTHIDKIALNDHCARILVHAPAAGFEVMSFCRARGFQEIDVREAGGEKLHVLERALR
ncbi:MAG: GNAT family N-acetyltransferase [Pseudomonadota bacterium]